MQRILSSQLHGHLGQTVRAAGWIHRRRLLKSVAFLILRDRDGLAQIVITEPQQRELLESLPEETTVSVVATVTANPSAPGGIELTEPQIEALTEPAVAAPFDLFRPQLSATLPTLLDHAPFALRHPRRSAVIKIGAAAVAGFRTALTEQSFVEIHTPKIVGTATESGATVFGLDYFGRRAFLAQSPQFYKQIMVGVLERVFEVGPVFRAEPHDTVRHLAEYTSLDAEMGFISDEYEVMAACQGAVAGMLEGVESLAAQSMQMLEAKMPALPAEIPIVHFTDVREMYTKATGEDITSEPDLAPAHERWLGGWALREHGSDFVFVTGFPTAHRAFYTHPDLARPGFSRGFDLIFRGLELLSGSQRMHRHSDYVAALAARGQTDLAPYAGYLDAMAHGMPPHGGFAFGLERFLGRLLDLPNVRLASNFPRDLNRVTP
ncbi:aspartate--tRNA(Asn) ligase [Streptomyces sp. NPDC051219]|uniref:aspartate--tRNA(Asn) ligase n=1 Tax=Streptomyces sp. NPDC051219 TaxID=3155283 RepID=UPI0034323D70